MSDWRELYETTVHEINPTNIEQRIRETEVALFVRLLELGTSAEVGNERREIEAAAKALAVLKEQTKL